MSRRTKLATALAATALGVTGFAALAPAADAATPSTASPAACDKAPWEAKVQGTDVHFGAGSRSGDYLWHNRTGFHLYVSHARNDRRIYTGEIHSSAPMRVERVKLERGDAVKLSRDRRTIVFVFDNHGRVDGIHFHTDCATRLTVSHLHIGNRNLGRDQVFLGATAAHPAHVPFTVHRLPVPTTSG